MMIMAFISNLWGKISGYALAGLGVLLAVLLIFQRGKSAGKEQAIRKQQEIDNAARARMDAIKPTDSAGTIDRLRDGEF